MKLEESPSVVKRLRTRWDSDQDRSSLLVIPTVLWFIAALIFPLIMIAIYSFLTYSSYSVVFEFTLQSWMELFTDPLTLTLFARSLGIGLVVTLLSLVFGYPLAYFLRFHVSSFVGLVLLLFLIIPFWTASLVRTTAWLPILGRTGFVNQVLIWVGVIEQPISWLLYSYFSVLVGYLQNYLLFMAAPIYISLMQIDDDLISASHTLRGGPITTFRRVIWPLSLPGVAFGAIFVFVLSIGNLFVPLFLSGGTSTVPSRIFSYINASFNYPAASALSLLLLIVILLCVAALIRIVDISEISR